jgi:hypothetical protein
LKLFPAFTTRFFYPKKGTKKELKQTVQSGLELPVTYLALQNRYSISKEVNLKEVPSNNPLSDNFKEGITNSAIKDKLI